MAVTILEALQNARVNLGGNLPIQQIMGQSQLNNAVTLLEKGYGVNELVEPLLEKYGEVEDVPEKELTPSA